VPDAKQIRRAEVDEGGDSVPGGIRWMRKNEERDETKRQKAKDAFLRTRPGTFPSRQRDAPQLQKIEREEKSAHVEGPLNGRKAGKRTEVLVS